MVKLLSQILLNSYIKPCYSLSIVPMVISKNIFYVLNKQMLGFYLRCNILYERPINLCVLYTKDAVSIPHAILTISPAKRYNG